MKINYELERQNLINFYNYYINSKSKWIRIIKKYFGIVYFSATFSFIIHTLSKLNLVLSIVAGIALSFLVIYALGRSQKANMFKNTKSLGKLQTIEISKNGVNKHSDDKDDFLPWDGIVSIVQDDADIYFFTNPKCALILPNRCFDSLEHKNQFIQLAEQYKNNFKG